jgi:methyl-accepting chemotaxis protein
MKKSLIGNLILIVSALVIAVLIIFTSVFYYVKVSPLESQLLQQSAEHALKDMNERMQNKLDSVIAMSASIAGYSEVENALADPFERDTAADKLDKIRSHFSSISQYKNIAVQLIDLDKTNLVRSWNTESFGDVLSHPFIDEVFQTKKVTGGIGVGIRGFGLSGFSPVFKGEQFVGVTVAIQGVGSVGRDLNEFNTRWVAVIDQRYLLERYGVVFNSVVNNPKFNQDYILAHERWFDKELFESLKSSGYRLSEGEKLSAHIFNDQLLIDLPIVDELGLVMGRSILLKPADELLASIRSAKNELYLLVASIIFVLMLASILTMYLVHRKIIKPINALSIVMQETEQTGSFALRAQTDNSKNEIDRMAISFNQLLESSQKALGEANSVVMAIAQGRFDQRIEGEFNGCLELLKMGVNGSADSVQFTMSELEKVMLALYEGDFSVRMDKRVPEAFRNKVEAALNAIDSIIKDINNVMAQMNEGDFGGQVTTEARGDLQTLKLGVNRSLHHIADAIKSISDVVAAQASGDLTVKLPAGKFKGELHDLKNAINYSSMKINEVVNMAIEVSDIVSNAAKEVSQGSSDLSQRLQEQAASLEQTSATMDQMTSQLESTTSNAEQATQMALDVRAQAQEGVQIMSDTISAMQSIEESSHRISEIVTLIDTIAFQTNLLALNAAVEAARAGEHGRGFAVVAGEVRSLAQKSAEAAKNIKILIEETTLRIERGSSLAQRTGGTLNKINDAVETVAQRIEQIAGAAAEQSQGVQQVNQAIGQIDGVTQQNAALVEQTTAAAESLSEQAALLQKEMGFFKTDTHPTYDHTSEPSAYQAKLTHQVGEIPTPVFAANNMRQRIVSKLTSQANMNLAKRPDNKEDWAEF